MKSIFIYFEIYYNGFVIVKNVLCYYSMFVIYKKWFSWVNFLYSCMKIENKNKFNDIVNLWGVF